MRLPELGIVRFIPARAGNASAALCVLFHARRFIPARAGNGGNSIAQSTAVIAGSSPRVRGTRRDHWVDRPLGRFIPARAGERPDVDMVGRLASPCGSSPRVRGNADLVPGAIAESPLSYGSSPRVRGTLRVGTHTAECGAAVHPRACGGTALVDECLARSSMRFIPARAGNARRPALFAALVGGSSPRVRGTRLGQHDRSRPCIAGSSPRVRGTR